MSHRRSVLGEPPWLEAPASLQWGGFFAMSAIWGSSYFFLKIASRQFEPYVLVALRMLVAATVLAAFVSYRRLWQSLPIRTWGRLAILALVNITVPFTMLTWAQQYVESSVTAVLSSTTPMFVFLVVCFVIREEGATWVQVLLTIVCMGGVYLLSGASGGDSSPVPDVVILCSSAVFAGGNVLGRRFIRGIHPLLAAWAQSTFAFAFEVPLALIAGRFPGSWNLGPTTAVLWLGAIGTAVAYYLYFHFIQTWGSTRTSWNTYLQPVVGLGLGVVVLGETLPARALIGIGLVIVGVRGLALAHRPLTSRIRNTSGLPPEAH
jgi:drug/metabolite transporter (DMT)-like permease